jgi:dipeptidyl aminopeptidase/acylaminoacyl peptidase
MKTHFILFLGLILLLPSTRAAQDSPSKVSSIELHSKSGGRVWVYLPQSTPPDTKLGCVLVPPAGSRLFHGMSLGDGDRVEHVPYVAAGFAVVSFDISGPWPDTGGDAALQKAIKEFANAKCGVTDALNALQSALDKYPQIDPNRIFVAGHSSAATLALQIAVASPRVKGCIAFAPITEVEKRIGASTIKTLDGVSPGIATLLHDLSPSNRVDALRCPVFLFHADDDSNVPTASIAAFRDALSAHNKATEFVSVASGGHYNSMIEQGIPKAITWLSAIDQKQKK